MHHMFTVALAGAISAAAHAQAVLPASEGVADTPQTLFTSHREVQCPHEVGAVELGRRPGITLQRARQEFSNGPTSAEIYWLDREKGTEVLAVALPAGASTRIDTFMGDRFVVRSAEDRSLLFDLVVGVHQVTVPNALLAECLASPAIQPKPKLPSEAHAQDSTYRAWGNSNPCDLVGYYVFPNGTERWMVDMVRSASPHRETTYLGHTFHFRTTTGKLVERFVVSSAVVPSCPAAARRPGAAAAASVVAAASAATLQVNSAALTSSVSPRSRTRAAKCRLLSRGDCPVNGTEANSTGLTSSASPRSRTRAAKSSLLSPGGYMANGESECSAVCVGSGSPAAGERAGGVRSLRLLAPRLD